jgi:hypothetical protein
MKRGIGILIVTLPLVLCGISACRGTVLPDIAGERIAVSLDPVRHVLAGESSLDLSSNGRSEIVFELHPGATVQKVVVDGTAVPVDFARGRLQVRLPPASGRQSRQITIAYRARFADPLPGRAAGTEDPSYGVNGVIGEGGVFLGGEVAWFPVPPVLPATRTIEITAPAGMEAITAGERLARRTSEGTSVSVWREAHPTGIPSLSAGRYLVTEQRLGELPIYTYFLADDARLASAYLEASARYLQLYQELFGPYPYEKFAVVENFIPTGYGFPSSTLMGGGVLRLPFIIDTSLPHEIAHNWWGNGVLVDSRGGNWSEGLATYVADYLLQEKKSPAAGRDYRFKVLTDYASLVTPATDFPLDRFIARSDPATRAIGYGKSAMVFHMVRTMIGDQAFFGALREICREKMYRQASWRDFATAFSRASGKDMAPFMDQWLTRTGGPRLSLSSVTSRNDGGKWIIEGTVVQAPPFWQFPLSVAIDTVSGDVRRTLPVEGGRTTFTLTASAPPRQLVLDPDSDLFRLLPPEEVPPAVNRIKGSRRLLAVVSHGCRARQETLKLLLTSLGQKDATIVGEDEMTAEQAADHDLLVCGVPDKTGLLAPLPGGMTVGRDRFTVGKETYSSPSDLFFAVTGRPGEPERMTALFLPLSPEAADDDALRITHYGTYGYLVFRGGKNQLKGLVPAAAGRTAVDLRGGGKEQVPGR